MCGAGAALRAFVLLLGAIVGFASIAAAQTPEVAFDLRIEKGRVAQSMRLIRVRQGDAVKLRWTTDRPIVLHLHGYDIETKVEPGAACGDGLHGPRDGTVPDRGAQAECARRSLAW